MSGHWTSIASFVDACVGVNRAVCAAIVDDELAAKRVPFTKAAVFSQDRWLDGGALKWDAVAVTRCQLPIPQYAVIGVEGQVQFIGSGDIHEERVQDAGIGPPTAGSLRNAKAIHGALYVCGMNRQVYRRDGRDSWRNLSNAITTQQGVYGFEAIDGFDATEVYGVGWEGEIWAFDGTSWQQHDAGTNVILVDLVCAGDGNVYVLGRGRKLIIGRGAAWKTMDLALPVELCAITWFEGKLYACSTRDIFVWNDAEFEVLVIPGERPGTLQYLSVGESGLCAVGPKDLFLFDGTSWVRID